MELLKMLKGYKTYLAMIALGVVGVLFQAGVIDADTARWISAILVPVAGISMRAGMAKSAK